MSEKPVTERLSVVENDIEHIKTTLDKIQGSISDLHNDIHNTQAQHNANINALRDEMLQNIEAHRKQTEADFKKAEKENKDFREYVDREFKDFREYVDHKFDGFAKEIREMVARQDDRIYKINQEVASMRRDMKWLYLIAFTLVGTTVANANGWFGLIGKLFTGG